MCNAFSCICPEVGGVIWKIGMDSHDGLIEKSGLRDDTNDPQNMTFARVEITPANKDYLHPDRWILRIDEEVQPLWWNSAYEAACWDAHKNWCEQLYKILDVNRKIVNPFEDVEPPKVIEEHIKLLKEWNSVGNSVRNSMWSSMWSSMWNSVGNSVGNSVRNSVRNSMWSSMWNSVGNSVRNSVRNSMWSSMWNSVGNSVRVAVCAQIGMLFNIWGKKYPFQSCVDLWNMGLVPSFDGETWRLHGGKEGKVLFEIEKDKLEADF